MDYGTITAIEIGKNKDGDEDVRLLTVEVFEDDDITVELRAQAGEEYNPAIGDLCYFEDVTDSYSVGLATSDPTEPDDTLLEGERELYAYDGAARKSKIRARKNGDIRVNDGARSAAAFDELKTAFDSLQATVDALADVINNLVLPVDITKLTAGPVPAPIALPSTANIDPAESKTLKIL